MRVIMVVVFVAFLTASCSPSPEAIQEAISQTQSAAPASTPSIIKTPTATSAPTLSPTPTPSPTPDLRVVDGDPFDFQLKPEDLPKESRYYLPDPSWTGRDSNTEVVQWWTIDEGREYLERTGRIDGWSTSLYRGAEVLEAPLQVYCDVVKYETSDGALISLSEYGLTAPIRGQNGYTKVDITLSNLQEPYFIYRSEKVMDSGEVYSDYAIETTYYNYLVFCFGWGRKAEVSPEYVENLVIVTINKLKKSPLLSP